MSGGEGFTSAPVEIAKAAWGDALPDWVLVLAEACEKTSQAKAAKELGVSASQISQVLRAKYRGALANIETQVRGRWMREIVMCPALGELALHDCANWRAETKSFNGVNSLRVRMYRACNRCPIHIGETEE